MTTRYTTVAKVKAVFADAGADPVIEDAIDLVTAHIDTYVGYRLAADIAEAPIDLLLDGSGTKYLMFPQDMHSFTVLKEIAVDESERTVPLVVPYPLQGPYTAYLSLRYGLFCAGAARYKALAVRYGRFTVAWGNTSHNLPNELAAVATALVVAVLKAGGTVQTTATNTSEKAGKIMSETIGSYQVSYASSDYLFLDAIGSVPSATEILKKYKQIVIA